MAAIIPMIATTMRSSISEKPSWRLFVFISLFVLLKRKCLEVCRANGFVRTGYAEQSAKCQAGYLQGLCHRLISAKTPKYWTLRLAQPGRGKGSRRSDKLRQEHHDGFRQKRVAVALDWRIGNQLSPALAANSDSSSSRRRGVGSEARRLGTVSLERRSSRIWAVRLRIPCLSNR